MTQDIYRRREGEILFQKIINEIRFGLNIVPIIENVNHIDIITKTIIKFDEQKT